MELTQLQCADLLLEWGYGSPAGTKSPVVELLLVSSNMASLELPELNRGLHGNIYLELHHVALACLLTGSRHIAK